MLSGKYYFKKSFSGLHHRVSIRSWYRHPQLPFNAILPWFDFLQNPVAQV